MMVTDIDNDDDDDDDDNNDEDDDDDHLVPIRVGSLHHLPGRGGGAGAAARPGQHPPHLASAR